eukprot:SAG31_NODE_4031_length_3649_cov_2.144225_1_plen_93_part_00
MEPFVHFVYVSIKNALVVARHSELWPRAVTTKHLARRVSTQGSARGRRGSGLGHRRRRDLARRAAHGGGSARGTSEGGRGRGGDSNNNNNVA